MATLADLLRAAGSGLYGSAGGFIPDTGVSLANLARAGYGAGGRALGLLSPSEMPDLIDPAQVPGTTANVSGLLGVGNSIPEQVAQFAGGLLGPGGKKAPSKLDMTVYHGSPHTFDQFDMSHLGSGEGAQAYGHGLYFADNPAVAKSYRYAGDNPKLAFTDRNGNRIPIDTSNDPATSMLLAHGSVDDALDAVQRAPADAFGGAQQKSEIAQNLLSMQRRGVAQRPAGGLYTVDIPDDAVANMLHWDKPLSQQAPSVQAALGASDKEAGLVHTMPDMTGQQLYNELSLAMGGRDKAASFLNQQGIPGIRYLDAGSRGVGDGTHNTVLFDDSLAKILGRE